MNPYNISNKSSIDSKQKAAIILIALGDKIAAEILLSFSKEDRSIIEESIKKLNYIPQNIIAQSIQELNLKIDNQAFSELRGGEEYLIKISKHRKASSSPENDMDFLEILNQANPIELAIFLQKESPQTTALILSAVASQRASKIISEMPLEKQTLVIIAFVELERLDQKSLKNLIRATETALEMPLNDKYNFQESACQILENLSPRQQNAVLDKMEEIHPEAAKALRMKIFLFDDIQYLNKEGIQNICQHANPLDLRLAFYDSREDLKNAFFAHISTKEMEILDRQLAQFDSITDASIQEAQHKIIQLLHLLEKENKIHREAIALQKNMISQKS